MNQSRQRATLMGAQCEIYFDDLTRQLYATDASIYQVEPIGVAFPKNARETASVIRAAAEADVCVIPRGAGTGLAGGALGEGLILDFSRYQRGIDSFNPEQRTVRVQSGVILDQLNDFLEQHGLCFGPDVATSSRATLGGMIANNSSGAHVPVYGTTVDHVRALDVVLADGRVEQISRDRDVLPELRRTLGELILPHEGRLKEQFHDELKKRWPGYGLAEYLRHPGDLTKLITGSEGTLAAITGADLDVVPLPETKGIGLLFFDSLVDAMQATVDLLDLEPAAIEHIDRVLFDQTKGKKDYTKTRQMLELDEKPCESILVVEFFADVEERLAELERRNLGDRTLILTERVCRNRVWAMRKAGLALLTGRPGSAKPFSGIEDAAVPPARLPEYVRALKGFMDGQGLEGSFYGHAASGLLHIRPVVDLHKAEDIAKFRAVAEEVATLVKEFKGSIAAEHGVGIARTEFLEETLGKDTLLIMEQVKQAFDPGSVLNPGKIVGDDKYRFDNHLRWGPGHETPIPFYPQLSFALKHESFLGNLEQCNGNGACRKESPTMCPTFIATGDEMMSTRGRANAIRAALEGRTNNPGHAVMSEAVDMALEYCLSCKACTSECPSNVNMTMLKADLLHARHQVSGIGWRERLFSRPDLLGKLGCVMPRLANATLTWPWLRRQVEKRLGISAKRALPQYGKRFDSWFARHNGAHGKSGAGSRGEVILWDDTFVRYHEPHIGQAAVNVLEGAGYHVILPKGRACCGRPAFSTGRLDLVRKFGERNLRLLAGSDAPIVFLEPSCYSMFIDDYRDMGLENAEHVAKRCVTFERFVADLLDRDPGALEFTPGYYWVAIHTHCHAKSLEDVQYMADLAGHLPNSDVSLLETGCCGMAGSYGMTAKKYDLSLKIAEPLVQQVQQLQAGTHVVASGTSCRHQLEDLTDAHPVHMAELLAEALASKYEG